MRVRVLVARWVEVKKAAMDRIDKAQREGLCLACMEPLDETRVVRGCHERCARATYRAIERGDFTEDERVQQGKWLSTDKGRKPSNPVTVEARSR